MAETVPSPTVSTPRRYALVVGVNAASGILHPGPLRHAEEHAQTVAEVLHTVCGCELVCDPLIGAQATTGAIRDALKTLAFKRGEQDLVLFYFADHGSLHKDHTAKAGLSGLLRLRPPGGRSL